jgi:asparagine synthase (glutamine-hydrolysing)
MDFGFIVTDRGADVEFRRFGRQPAGRPPLVTLARHDRQCLVLMGRLYYRSELLARLGRSEAALAASADAELALAAYRQWGTEGLSRLEGDFSLALYDAAENLLLAARDPSGGYPLFWTEQQGRAALSTSLRVLASQSSQCMLNRDFLAEYLMLPAQAFQEVPSEECVYQGIHRLLPGTILQIRLAAGTVSKQTHWNWRDKVQTLPTGQVEPLAEEFAERLRLAVRERLRGAVASHFSGGMDSTGVALIARDWLVREGGGPVHAIALVFDKLAGLAKENPYIEAALRDQPGVQLHRICGDDVLDYDSFLNPPVHDEPFAGLRGLARDRAMADAAAAAGADTLLTGVGADDLVEVFPYHITDLLRRGRLGAAWHEARRWARATNNSPWMFLSRFGLANLRPAWLRAGLGSAMRGGRAGEKNLGEGTIAPWIQPEFARRHGMRARGVAALRRIYGTCRPISLSMVMASLTALSGDGPRWFLAAPHGMVIAHPFLDPRVARLGLAIQAGFRQEPGKQKPLLVHAFRNVLPPEILTRRRKGHFNEAYFHGLSRNQAALETMIHSAPVDDLGLLDKPELIRHLRQTALGVEHSAAGAIRLDLTLALVKWLSMYRQWLAMPLDSPAETAYVARGSARGEHP